MAAAAAACDDSFSPAEHISGFALQICPTLARSFPVSRIYYYFYAFFSRKVCGKESQGLFSLPVVILSARLSPPLYPAREPSWLSLSSIGARTGTSTHSKIPKKKVTLKKVIFEASVTGKGRGRGLEIQIDIRVQRGNNRNIKPSSLFVPLLFPPRIIEQFRLFLLLFFSSSHFVGVLRISTSRRGMECWLGIFFARS